jgi:hypothetical protein
VTMSPTIAELRAMTDEQLVETYDSIAKHTGVGTQFYLDELVRRQSERTNFKLIALTDQIRMLTLAVAGASVIALAIAVVALIRG